MYTFVGGVVVGMALTLKRMDLYDAVHIPGPSSINPKSWWPRSPSSPSEQTHQEDASAKGCKQDSGGGGGDAQNEEDQEAAPKLGTRSFGFNWTFRRPNDQRKKEGLKCGGRFMEPPEQQLQHRSEDAATSGLATSAAVPDTSTPERPQSRAPDLVSEAEAARADHGESLVEELQRRLSLKGEEEEEKQQQQQRGGDSVAEAAGGDERDTDGAWEGSRVEKEVGVDNGTEKRDDCGKEEARDGEMEDKSDSGSMEKDQSQSQYPVRPEAEDCAYYMKTGTCRFGSNCKFNHPVRRKGQDKVKGQEESSERPGQTECKYYLRSGGCKYGKACRFNHTKGNTAAVPILELNFLGLPIRPGEKECPYYMRTGSCKYGANCRFNHPEPTAVASSESAAYGNGGPVSLRGTSQGTMGSWSSPGALNETTAFMPMMFPPTPTIPSPNSEWNGYQAPAYPLERSVPSPQAYLMNGPLTESSAYTQQQRMLIEDFPERPGQPDCSYFMKTGDCKYRSNCKFHHPKSRNTKTPTCTLSDKGLPLRPGQNVCTFYSRYGICKFGPACKFDHSIDPSSTVSGLDQSPVFGNSTTADGATAAGTRNGSEAANQ